jgi:hypothetical protein
MKAVMMKNRFNNERVVCEDIKDVRLIEGIEYLVVRRQENINRTFLMRKDALQKVTGQV